MDRIVSLPAGTRSRASKPGSPTSAISGPYGSGSSASAVLALYLANRCRARLVTDGLIEARLTWREKATPSGRRYLQLAVSARRIDEIDCGLWPTMTLSMQNTHATRADERPRPNGKTLFDTAMWSTPRASDGEKGGPNQSFGAGGQPLPAQAYQTLWPTPLTSDHRSVLASPETHDSNARPLREQVGASLGLWATPKNSDHRPGLTSRSMTSERVNLNNQAHGAARSGSPAPTAKRGGLAPEFVAWLLGYPEEWMECAPTRPK